MSIREVVAAWLEEGTLSCVRREIDIGARLRSVVAGVAVQRALSGPWSTEMEEDRYGRAKAIIDLFIGGELMAVRLSPSRSARAQLALLDPPSDRVWEFRTPSAGKRGAPRYGVRVFGMFAEKDLFVATSAAFKEDLLIDDKEYRMHIETARRQWRIFFASYDPNLGPCADAYVSNAFLV